MPKLMNYFVVGLKLLVISIISLVLWFTLTILFAFLLVIGGIFTMLISIIWAILVIFINGFIARKLWGWK